MLRSALLTATLSLGLGILAQAQLVNNGGYATTAPSVVNANGAPSVPAIDTPVAHVGPQAGPATQTGETQSEPTTQPAELTSGPQPVNMGVASVETNPFLGSNRSSDESLGDIARSMKTRAQTANAKTFTNADIDKLNGSSTNSTSVNASNDNWPANNGVITQEPSNNQGAIAAPAQNQSTTGNNPFSPKGLSSAPVSNDNNLPPQANGKPSANRPYEMAQNNPSNAGIPQQADQPTRTDTDDAAHKTLPKTASRLPLIGVLGFLSISMGLFVRYQREKDAK